MPRKTIKKKKINSTDCTNHGKNSGNSPHDETDVDASGVLEHAGRRYEDAGADDAADDDGHPVDERHLRLEGDLVLHGGGGWSVAGWLAGLRRARCLTERGLTAAVRLRPVCPPRQRFGADRTTRTRGMLRINKPDPFALRALHGHVVDDRGWGFIHCGAASVSTVPPLRQVSRPDGLLSFRRFSAVPN